MTNTNSASAVSDYTLSFDSSTNLYNNNYLCGGSSGRNCSDYTYLIFETSSLLSSNLEVRYNSGGFYLNSNLSSYSILDLSDYSFSFIFLYTNTVNSIGSATVTFTLTNSLPSSCPPVEPCPEIPEYPYTDQLDEIKQAIILVPAVCLVIYFFYAIYKMIMGGVRR